MCVCVCVSACLSLCVPVSVSVVFTKNIAYTVGSKLYYFLKPSIALKKPGLSENEPIVSLIHLPPPPNHSSKISESTCPKVYLVRGKEKNCMTQTISFLGTPLQGVLVKTLSFSTASLSTCKQTEKEKNED